MISILISTRNRPQKIKNCIKFILKNYFKKFEIILIDQSTNSKTKKIVKKIKARKIRYLKLNNKGKSKALNLTLKKATEEIFAFTDDDCIVDKNWLKNIYQSFQKNKNIVGVFGKVLPYRPQLNKNKVCPCTFLNNKKRVISMPCYHAKNIGFGNNMAFRRNIFEEIGGFKEWLGAGSITLLMHLALLCLRVLLKDHKILYNPKVKVYHNRWLTKNQFKKPINIRHYCSMRKLYHL